MHLLKNFGNTSTGKAVTNIKSNGNLGSNPAYFSSVNFSNGSLTSSKQNPSLRQGPPQGFIPQKYALHFSPPTIILQYSDPMTKQLYHHKMTLPKLTKQTPVRQALAVLKQQHRSYFSPQVIDQAQIEKLITKLKNGIIQEESINEEFDFDEVDISLGV